MKTQILRVLKASTMVGLAAVLVMSLNSAAHASGRLTSLQRDKLQAPRSRGWW